MPAFGSNAKFAIAYQNSFGDYTVDSWFKVPFASQDFNFAYDELTDDSIYSRYDEPDRVTGIAGVSGSFEANVHPLVVGNFIRGNFAQYSVSALGSGYEHTFNPQTTTFDANVSLPPYSFYVDQGQPLVNSGYQLQDCFINEWELSLAAGQYLRSRFNVVGKQAALITKVTVPDYPTGIKPFIWSSASISIGGVAIKRFQDFSISFNNNIGMQDRIAGEKTHTFYMRDGFRQFGRMTATIDVDMDTWLAVKDETEYQVIIHVLGVTSISSGVNEYLQVDIPRFVYTSHPLGVSGAGIVTVSIEGRAMYHSGSETIATVTLVNTVPDYGPSL